MRTATIIEPRCNGPEQLDASINPRASRFEHLFAYPKRSIEGIADDSRSRITGFTIANTEG